MTKEELAEKLQPYMLEATYDRRMDVDVTHLMYCTDGLLEYLLNLINNATTK